MPRNYRKEYDNYQGNTEQKRRRAARNKARGILVKAGVVKKGDGKDVAHKDGNPTNNAKGNLKASTKRANRSYKRTKTARKAAGAK